MEKMKMRKYVIPVLAMAVMTGGCDDRITDFGFTGSISGTISDPAGNIVSGNNSTSDFQVFLLGEGETQPLQIRVKGDGTYANTHLFPQSYQVWLEGPIEAQATQNSPVVVDLSGAPVTQNFTVTPFLTIARPTAGQPTSNSVEVTFDITPNGGRSVQTGSNRVVWASTASWPGSTTGNVADRTHTVATSLPGNSGTVTINDLRPGTRYYIRVGARAVGTTLWNLSDQISITTP